MKTMEERSVIHSTVTKVLKGQTARCRRARVLRAMVRRRTLRQTAPSKKNILSVSISRPVVRHEIGGQS